MNATYLLIFLIAAIHILEPEFFGLLPEWLTLWGKMLNLSIYRRLFLYKLKRQIKRDRKEFEKFIEEYKR